MVYYAVTTLAAGPAAEVRQQANLQGAHCISVHRCMHCALIQWICTVPTVRAAVNSCYTARAFHAAA
jgi:formate hydrogenlyase subunit 6/NADH:ubiquinone oxidoreductase subunit I